MRYQEGARFFFRALAESILLEVGSPRSVQLVTPKHSSPPEEDCFGLARALASREDESLVEPRVVVGTTIGPDELPAGPVVLDFLSVQEDHQVSSFRAALEERSDVVVVVERSVAMLGCQVVQFDSNDLSVFDAVTDSFGRLVELAGFRGQALEMPARFLKGGLRSVNRQFGVFEQPATTRLVSPDEIERFCAGVSRTWNYAGAQVPAQSVFDWVMQFEPYDVLSEALTLLGYLNRYGFIPKGSIVNMLTDEYERLRSDLRQRPSQATIQSIGKSEAMLYYDLRQIRDSPTPLLELVAQRHVPDHIVCFDDVIGSGDSMLECLYMHNNVKMPNELHRWFAEGENRTLTIVVAVSSLQGKIAIERNARSYGRVKVRAHRVLAENDSIFSGKKNLFESEKRSGMFQAVCQDIGEKLFSWGPLGWNDCQWCIATDYNVPDCSLPILWASGDENFRWVPLFARR